MDDEVQAPFEAVQQGDVLRALRTVPVLGAAGATEQHDCPSGVVLISQTCDIVRDRTRTIQVAPVVELTGAMAQEARIDLRPRYAHIPALGDDAFADLDIIVTLTKEALQNLLPVERGLFGDEDVRQFSRRIVRKSARFAFPDAVSDALRPLEKVLGKKARRPTSHEGRCLEEVSQLRVEADGPWAEPPWDVTLIVCLSPDALPALAGDDAPMMSKELATWLRGGSLSKSRDELAQRLVDSETNPQDRIFLWQALADAWTDTCVVEAQEDDMQGMLRSISTEVLTEHDLPMSRYLTSELLDLDHLSSPRVR